jgi:hypothetical protein
MSESIYGPDPLDQELKKSMESEDELTPWEEEEFDRQAAKAMQWQRKKAMQAASQRQQHLTQQGLQAAAKELGVEPQDLLQALNRDPDFAERAYVDGVRNYYKQVVTRQRDPKTGRFMSAETHGRPRQREPEPQGQRGGTDNFFAPDRAVLPDRENRVQAMRAVAQKSRGTDDDLDSMLKALLPDDGFLV